MTQPCPRQLHEAVMRAQIEHQSHWKEDRTCSYCGSMMPEDVFKAIDEGCKIGPTDKNYKIYIDLPPTGFERVFGSTWSAESPGNEYIEATPEICERLKWKPWGEEISHHANKKLWVTTGVDTSIHAKFYFQHFNETERDKFIEAYNNKRINMGYPGHFYVAPYFCKRVDDP